MPNTITFRIEAVDHRVPLVARQLHAVQMSAYAQEASLLGAVRFPPLERTVRQLQDGAEAFLAAFVENEIVVAPQFQRHGKRLRRTDRPHCAAYRI